MAIDPHDDEAAARALLAAAEANVSPATRWLRQNHRLYTRTQALLSISLAFFLAIALWRFIGAMQSKEWLPFWITAIGVFAPVLIPVYMALHDQTADRNSALAYQCLADAVRLDDESPAVDIPALDAPRARPLRLSVVQIIGQESETPSRVRLAILVVAVSFGIFASILFGALYEWDDPRTFYFLITFDVGMLIL